VYLEGSDDSKTTWVPVYCLSQHQPPPTLTTTVVLDLMGLVNDVDPPPALQDLIVCLPHQGLDRTTRDQAVWLVAQGHLGRSREELRELLLRANLIILNAIDTTQASNLLATQLGQRRHAQPLRNCRPRLASSSVTDSRRSSGRRQKNGPRPTLIGW
jgi:hypothetical protein